MVVVVEEGVVEDVVVVSGVGELELTSVCPIPGLEGS